MGEVNDLQGIAVQLANELVNIAPDALELALRVTRIRGIGGIILGVIMAVLGPLLLRYGIRHFFLMEPKPTRNVWDTVPPDEAVSDGLAIVSMFVGGIATVISLVYLLDIWTWIRAFMPHVGFAYDVMRSLGAR